MGKFSSFVFFFLFLVFLQNWSRQKDGKTKKDKKVFENKTKQKKKKIIHQIFFPSNFIAPVLKDIFGSDFSASVFPTIKNLNDIHHQIWWTNWNCRWMLILQCFCYSSDCPRRFSASAVQNIRRTPVAYCSK